MIYGYARVSTKGQAEHGNSLTDQEEKLRAAGAEIIYADAFTGTKGERPELSKLLEVISEGDTLVVTKLDRVARSIKVGADLIESLMNKGITVNILNLGVLDNTPNGKLMRNIFLAFAEFERDMIVERTKEGKDIARQSPDYKDGRPMDEIPDFEKVAKQVKKGKINHVEAGKKLGISRQKFEYRYKKWLEK